MSVSTGTKLVLPVGPRDHVQGSDNAPVTLVEYGDFECPHCGTAFVIVDKILEIMGDQLRFVFRHFPLTQIHPHAEPAAEASEAAGAQGRFWEMHHVLFKNQHLLEPSHLVDFAEALGLDMERFGLEFEQHKYHDRVREDFMSGVRSGVNGTPTFFINGYRYEESWDLPPLLAALESEAVAVKARAHGAR
jgi:protein-disulfide isomerase